VPENPLDPVRVDPERYRVNSETHKCACFTCISYGPKETGVVHEHILNRVIVALTGEDMKVATPEGRSRCCGARRTVSQWEAGRRIRNLLPFEVVVVELKR